MIPEVCIYPLYTPCPPCEALCCRGQVYRVAVCGEATCPVTCVGRAEANRNETQEVEPGPDGGGL